MMSRLSTLFIISLFTVQVFSELNSYRDLENIVPEEYQKSYQEILDDKSVTEDETNKQLVELGEKFNEADNIRGILKRNEAEEQEVFKYFIKISQRLPAAVEKAETILNNIRVSAKEQYRRGTLLNKRYPLEISLMLHLASKRGYKSAEEIIDVARSDKAAIEKLAAELEEYAIEAQSLSYTIADEMFYQRYRSREDREKSEKYYRTNAKKAMKVYNYIYNFAKGNHDLEMV